MPKGFRGFQKGHKLFKEGEKTRFQKGLIPWNWKGDEVGYHALHHWVERYLEEATRRFNLI